MKNFFLFSFLMVSGISSFAQQQEDPITIPISENASKPIHWSDPKNLSQVRKYEDSLVYLLDSVYLSSDYGQRELGNIAIIKTMKRLLNTTESFTSSLDSLKTRMNIIEPNSKAFRIYNWNMLNEDGLAKYYGVIQMNNGKFYPLIDISTSADVKLEDTIVKDTRWIGAIYYNILEKQTPQGNVYFLFGSNSGSKISDKKFVECLYFKKTGEPVFGAPLFQSYASRKPKLVNRFVYEYQKGSSATLNWNAEAGIVIMDHLESTIGDFSKRYTFVGDGAYDGLQWNGKNWLIVPNAINIIPTAENNVPVQEVEKKELITPSDFEEVSAPTKSTTTKQTPAKPKKK
jgi:hypothetical protein